MVVLLEAPGPEGVRLRMKLDSVLDRNEGYQLFAKVRTLLEIGDAVAEIYDHFFIDEVLNLKYALLTSCDVERAFSRF